MKKILLILISDDNLPLNKMLNLHMLTVIVRSVFEEDGKYYPQSFLDDFFVWSINARLWHFRRNWYLKQMHQKNVMFAIIGFKYEPYPCNDCHDLIQKAINFNDVAIVSAKGSYYRIISW